MLNIYEIANEYASSSAYLIDSYDLLHARLGHLSMNMCRLKTMHDKEEAKVIL